MLSSDYASKLTLKIGENYLSRLSLAGGARYEQCWPIRCYNCTEPIKDKYFCAR